MSETSGKSQQESEIGKPILVKWIEKGKNQNNQLAQSACEFQK